eukprot:1284232-Prymnesium_polylepis.1
MPLCASLRPLVELAPAASHASISLLASRSNPLLAACHRRPSEHLRLEMRSESRGMSVGEQKFASERVSQLCAHGGSQTRARRGSSPRVL